MVYVGISRVQSLSQLFILGKLPIDKMVPWPDALLELERLESFDLAYDLVEDYAQCFVITSLNTIDIRTHINDIKADRFMTSANVNLFQETSLDKNSYDGQYDMASKLVYFNSVGHQKGIASYVPPNFNLLNDINQDKFQMSTFLSNELAITNVYRSNNAPEEFLANMINCVESVTTTHMFIGDFNYCLRDQPHHPVKNMFEELGFQLIPSILHQPPDATHIMGRCIDHAWIRLSAESNIGIVKYDIRTCVFSDHDIQCIVLKISDNMIPMDPETNEQPNMRNNFLVINDWLDTNSHKLRGEFKKCYLTNPDLQSFFDEVKIPDTFLPSDTMEAYLFRNIDDAIEFEKYFKHERNMKHISTIVYNDENHLKEIFNWEAEHGHQRTDNPYPDNFECQLFEEGPPETDLGPNT